MNSNAPDLLALEPRLRILAASLDGELHYDRLLRTLYATDASVYRELPLAVAYPRHADDIRQLIAFAKQNEAPLIPRAAGTSLAGQCVGNGIVVDVSKYMTEILEINAEENWVRVQPGVIRDELNHHLKPHGLFFGPNTSTSNRAMIGGMVGNNSCGSYSITYGTTRDHLLEVNALLSDGSEATFGPLDREGFEAKARQPGREGHLYRQIVELLHKPANQAEILEKFPPPEVTRRNTGYALDALLASNRFTRRGPDFNFCNLIAGSEGTICFITEVKLHCDPLPPPVTGLICTHFHSIDESLRAVVVAMEQQPRACELMDKIILDCTLDNLMYRPYRFFVEGDPEAILVIEFAGENEDEVRERLDAVEKAFKVAGLGYSHPRVFGAEKIKKVWALRSAGLGLLANVPGDAKAVAVIEDTAVDVRLLPEYIREFTAMMSRYGQKSVYYAHAGAGELHLRPILDLKDSEDRRQFREIARETAELVAKYNGSLSGEHGDGRVRAEFIPVLYGEKVYDMLRRVKQAWDPENLFNPGKIVDAAPMDEMLRYESGQKTPEFDTVLDFGEVGGILRMAEKCNGSGDCRKIPESGGGIMCPSYMATRNEKDTTRARANVLREFLTRSTKANRFDHQEIKEAMDLCLSCKGCVSECPSNVDVASLKAEWQHQYYKAHGVPLRARLFANYARLNGLGAIAPGITNRVLRGKTTSGLLRKIMGVHPKRSLPLLNKMTLRGWYKKAKPSLRIPGEEKGSLWLYCDEFIDLNDTHIGIKTIQLLTLLGYRVEMIDHPESGRASISKGLLPRAKKLAEGNVRAFAGKVTEDKPLVGIEPSAILGFRDEFPRLVDPSLVEAAKEIALYTMTIEEFLVQELKKDHIGPNDFHDEGRNLILHGHCHQKALSSTLPTEILLNLPENYTAKTLPTGCCGMAGSFGYEAEHYDVSMQVGELVLFPAVREAAPETVVVAPGTSCRHQIHDGTGRRAVHPVEVLLAAVRRG